MNWNKLVARTALVAASVSTFGAGVIVGFMFWLVVKAMKSTLLLGSISESLAVYSAFLLIALPVALITVAVLLLQHYEQTRFEVEEEEDQVPTAQTHRRS